MPLVASACGRSTGDAAAKQPQTYLSYLEALLTAELEDRERNTIARRIKDARLPRMKTLDDFDFSKAPKVPATMIHELTQGGYIASSGSRQGQPGRVAFREAEEEW